MDALPAGARTRYGSGLTPSRPLARRMSRRPLPQRGRGEGRPEPPKPVARPRAHTRATRKARSR